MFGDSDGSKDPGAAPPPSDQPFLNHELTLSSYLASAAAAAEAAASTAAPAAAPGPSSLPNPAADVADATNAKLCVDATNAKLCVDVVDITSSSCTTWSWRGMRMNYLVREEGPPVLLVHGFGASVTHWRRNISVLSESNMVYAIDLLGFGASDKPARFSYTMETWAELILEFLEEVVKRPTVLVGNSVGSLACVIVASGSTSSTEATSRCSCRIWSGNSVASS